MLFVIFVYVNNYHQTEFFKSKSCLIILVHHYHNY